jgi:glycosyltransferase involved in cell wall biosynthesis
MKKSIVFFVESMNCGGAEKSLLSLLNNFNPDLYNVDLLVDQKGGEFEIFIPEYVNYKSLELKFSVFNRIIFKLFKMIYSKPHKAQVFWKALKNSIPEYKQTYDIAVAWGQGFATYFVSEKITASKKYAWVNTDYEKAGYIPKYDMEAYSKFNKIVGISDFVKMSMQKIIDPKKVISIRNIIDIDDVRKQSLEPVNFSLNNQKLNIVTVGRLAKYKAFDLGIEAAKILATYNIEFNWYFIGEGNERNYLQNLINEYKLNECVKLIGFKSNPYPYIKACDVYVQTSSFEGLGRTLIEASILYKPIVTTNFPTAYGLVEDGKTGFVTEMEAEKLAEKIALLHSNKDLYLEMIKELISKTDNEKQNTLEKVYNLFDS